MSGTSDRQHPEPEVGLSRARDAVMVPGVAPESGPLAAITGYAELITQLVPSWARPRLTSRFRLMAAARTVSQMRFFSLPR